jgi:hypothetical protein
LLDIANVRFRTGAFVINGPERRINEVGARAITGVERLVRSLALIDVMTYGEVVQYETKVNKTSPEFDLLHCYDFKRQRGDGLI